MWGAAWTTAKPDVHTFLVTNNQKYLVLVVSNSSHHIPYLFQKSATHTPSYDQGKKKYRDGVSAKMGH